MFNRKNLCNDDFIVLLLKNLEQRQYNEDFLNRVKELQSDIILFFQLEKEIQDLQKKRNIFIREGIGKKEEVIDLNQQIHSLESKNKIIDDKINVFLPMIPNILHSSVPIGINEKGNIELYRVGNPVEKSRVHYDMELIGNGNELVGSRFIYLQGQIATLERALGNFLINFLLSQGFEEVSVPLILNKESLKKSGHIPKEEENMFAIEGKDWYLIPTSECVLVNLMGNMMVKEMDLPKKFTAFNYNFRKEAGSYGKDTKGLIRLHQFPKVEMVSFTKDELTGMEMFNDFISNATRVLKLLDLPYRVISLCSGDLGFNASMTHDIEVWMAGSKEYREISSISYCGTFQSENLKARWIDDNGKKHLLHSLNGTCVAVGRLLAAIMEYYYDEDGYIKIPEVLHHYTGFKSIKVS